MKFLISLFLMIGFLFSVNNTLAQSLTTPPTVATTTVSTTSPTANSASASAELAGLLTAYQSYQADFSQITYDSAGRILQRTDGNVKILRPGRFRWQTSSPLQQLVIANGNILWVYDVELAQVSKQTLQQQGLSPAVLLSSSAADLAQKFNVRLSSDQWFELLPKQRDDNFPLVRLRFDQGKLSALQMVNALGQNSVFYFKNIILNQSLSPNWFIFVPPAGVDVLSS